MPIEHLLCAMNCTRYWGSISERNRLNSLPSDIIVNGSPTKISSWARHVVIIVSSNFSCSQTYKLFPSMFIYSTLIPLVRIGPSSVLLGAFHMFNSGSGGAGGGG